MDNPTVFVSYSHDSEQHEAWVLKLASDLRSHGVNAILDRWDLRLGSDLRFFMENGLSSANLVLCICSENYVQKVDSGVGGAGYEGMIMSQPLLSNANLEYVIPIVRNNPSFSKVPRAFGSKLYIDFSDDSHYVAKYWELLERIYGEDSKKKPPLGSNPFSAELSKRIAVKTEIEKVLYHSPEMDGTVIFRFDNNNGVYTIGNGEYAFDTRWSGCGNNSIYAMGLVGFKPEVADFPPGLHTIISYDFSSATRRVETGQIVIFENLNRHFAAVKLGPVKRRSHNNPYDEMTFEYHIYYPE
ncbi:MAG: toll/interleukin-1 receptor domain-containing protein [Lachnospiraceae bacterium]|nr:toll/interleukin-1 receptor domain-containing protein [Lachnospiraceae bacterium]